MKTIKEQYLGILFSIFVGVLMVLPQIIFIFATGDDYQGIYMMHGDAEMHYLARMQEFVDNNSIGNPFIYEFKEGVPSTFNTYGEALLALPAKIFGISIPTINLLYKFTLPIVISLLVYFFIYRILHHKFWAVTGVALILLGRSLFYIPTLTGLVSGEMFATEFATYARPINPQLSSIFFFTYLHLLLSAFKNPKWKNFVWLALVLNILG